MGTPAIPGWSYGGGSSPRLIASMNSSAPFLAGSPKGSAAPPVRKTTTPTLSWSGAPGTLGVVSRTGNVGSGGSLGAVLGTPEQAFNRIVPTTSRATKGGKRLVMMINYNAGDE